MNKRITRRGFIAGSASLLAIDASHVAACGSRKRRFLRRAVISRSAGLPPDFAWAGFRAWNKTHIDNNLGREIVVRTDYLYRDWDLNPIRAPEQLHLGINQDHLFQAHWEYWEGRMEVRVWVFRNGVRFPNYVGVVIPHRAPEYRFDIYKRFVSNEVEVYVVVNRDADHPHGIGRISQRDWS